MGTRAAHIFLVLLLFAITTSSHSRCSNGLTSSDTINIQSFYVQHLPTGRFRGTLLLVKVNKRGFPKRVFLEGQDTNSLYTRFIQHRCCTIGKHSSGVMECLVRFQLALNTNYTLSIDVTKGQRLVVERTGQDLTRAYQFEEKTFTLGGRRLWQLCQPRNKTLPQKCLHVAQKKRRLFMKKPDKNALLNSWFVFVQQHAAK